ncbi:MAG: CPBP family intramembrane metalloprotease [Caulobacterales bacterium]|nr:CPBP family intramembrane metalloprotease [Caulobacterales bacterium]
MPDALISILAVAGIILAACVIGAVLHRGRVAWGWIAAALILIVVHDALLTNAWGLLALPGIGETWNWTGKLLALAGTMAVAAHPAIGFRRSGLTLAQDQRGLPGALTVSAMLVLIFAGLAIWMGGEGGSAEDFAFQLTMPGIEEEIFYRGVLLLMFNEAFRRPLRVLGAPMGWAAILTSLAFGLDHAFSYSDGAFSFDVLTLALTGAPALILVWLREKTGSVLLPILLHNYANVIFMAV